MASSSSGIWVIIIETKESLQLQGWGSNMQSWFILLRSQLAQYYVFIFIARFFSYTTYVLLELKEVLRAANENKYLV